MLLFTCEDNLKYGLLSKHLFERQQQHSGWKKAEYQQLTFIKNNAFHPSRRVKKHSSKQLAPVTYNLEKTFFAASTFEGL